MDKEKIDYIAGKYLDSVYHIAVNYCKNAEDAEDAVQNAFVKLMTTDMVFNDDEHIHRWLIKVTINECKMFWRSFWRRNTESLDAMYEANKNHPALMQAEDDRTELAQALADAVIKIPAKYSTVIHLHYYEGYSVDEIADILGLTPSNVTIRLHRGRQKLKKLLGDGAVK